jgi:hypothetical protein
MFQPVWYSIRCETAIAANTTVRAETAAVKAGGGHYADVTGLFCTAERCPAIVGNTLVYWDRKHTTFEYARLLASVLGALADRSLAGRLTDDAAAHGPTLFSGFARLVHTPVLIILPKMRPCYRDW